MPADLLLVLIVILVVAIVWRGPKTLPKLGEALGRGIREARTEATKAQDEIQTRMDGTDESARPGADESARPGADESARPGDDQSS